MEKVRLGDKIKQIRGVSYKPTDLHNDLNDSSVILLRANNISDGKLNFDDVVYVDKSKVKEEQYLKKGDILVCASSGSKELVGKSAFVEKDFSVTFGAFCKLIRPMGCIAEYLGHYFNSQIYREKISALALGANINNIRNEHIDELFICFPNELVQKSIASLLDKVTDLINKRKQQLEKLDEFVKARFVELFGDPLDNTKGLPIEPFANCCLDMHQGINTVADKVEYQPYGYPIIQSKNITKGFLDLDDVRYLTNEDYEKYRGKYNPKVNDILICNIGTIGKSLVIKDEKNFLIAWNLFLVKLNLEKVNPDYIKVFVEFLNDRHYYDQFLTGGTVKFVNKKTMGNIPVLMPSIEQQTQFADFVKQTDKSKFEIKQSLEKLELLKKALMQKYFG